MEPDPRERRWLLETRDLNCAAWHVEVRPLADHPGRLAWRSAGPTLAHLAPPSSEEPAALVETSTLDDLVQALGLEPTRLFVKIDVEGWEPAVLASGLKTIGEGVRGLWLEANGLQHRCPIPWEEAATALSSLGYKAFVVDACARQVMEIPSRELPRVSPTGNYLLLPAGEAADRVRSSVDEWDGVLLRASQGRAQKSTSGRRWSRWVKVVGPGGSRGVRL